MQYIRLTDEPSPSFNRQPLSSPAESQAIKRSNSFLAHGIVASVLLTVAYFAVVGLVESFDHAVAELISLFYLFVPLIASFGIQMALFSYARQQSKVARQRSTNVSASGGMSTVSMILCCAHHLTDVAAFVGLAAVTLFLTTYQPVFLLIGIVSNVIGILTVLLFLQKNRLYAPTGLLAKPMRLNMGKARSLAAVTGVLVVVLAFALVALTSQTANAGYVSYNLSDPSPSPSPSPYDGGVMIALPPKIVSQNGLTIQATLQPFKLQEPIKISLALDTHSGDLEIDLTQRAELQDNNGITYATTGWDGSPPSGHHVSGTLNFPALNGAPSSLRLILVDVYGANWTFDWNLSD